MTAPAAPLVFVVDDDASVRKGLARLIKTAGYEAEGFASVPAAWSSTCACPG